MIFGKKKNHSSDREDCRRIISDEAPFSIKEAFRSLYSNVLYLPIEDKCKKIAITSAFSGEGKTYISVNLALTIAKSSPESRVLLIDADMRNPRVARILKLEGLANNHGLSEYLAGIDNEPNFVKTANENLFVLRSGAENSNALALLSSSRMKMLVEYLSDKFDYVIFDTSPVNLVSDGLLLSDNVNGYLVVTRADYSDVDSVSEALENLSRVEANVFGFVICSVNTQRKEKRYGRYSGYYYRRDN